MKNMAEDRRVRKTKHAFQRGLALLMMEKELRQITVRELSDLVDLHRATFYTHYRDIYDLYKQMEESVLDELGKIIAGGAAHTYEDVFQDIIEYISENKEVSRLFLNRSATGSIQNRLRVFLERKYLELWDKEPGKGPMTMMHELLAGYHIQGCLAVVSRWAEQDYRYPKEELVSMVEKIDAGFEDTLLKLL